MRYLGGKWRIREWVGEAVLARVPDPRRRRYVEPFVGSAAVWTLLAPLHGNALGADAHPDLVMLLNAAREGWRAPEVMTIERYERLRRAEPSAERGFAGFMCSFGGMHFRGYFENYPDGEARLRESRVAVARLGRRLRECPPLARMDYREVAVACGDVVYCDPPYHGTESYGGTGFCSYRFWAEAARWARAGAAVLVSEEQAPRNWVVAAETRRKGVIGNSRCNGGRPHRVRTERIFVHESQATAAELLRHREAVRRGDRPWPAIE